MAYERIDWENEPSVDTPLNEDNLNHMEDGIVQNETDIAGKMNANNPTGTGSFSLNRKSGTTIGNHSFAEGWDTEASGSDSHAEGGYTKASGSDSHAEGQGTEASSFGTHAEGLFTEASGPASHAEGLDTKALANASHAQNRGTIAASEDQTAMGRFNIADNHAEYARIVGNGTDNNNRSNAETLDWDGNLTVAGDYTNGNGETLHGAYQAFIDGLPVDSESGNPCVITDAFNTDAKSVKLTLNPIQSGSGTPSPSNVRPISGRTQSKIYRYGKNLFDASGVVRKNTKRLSAGLNLKVNAGDSFVFSSDYAGLQFAVGIHSASVGGSEIEDSGWLNADASYTFTHDGYIQSSDIGIRKSDDSTISDTEMANIKNAHTQLEYGSTATTYEPYTGETYTIDLDGTRYGGTVDFKTGLMTITKEIKSLTVEAVGPAASGTKYADCQYSGEYNTPAISNMYTQINTSATGYNGMFKVYNIAITVYDDRFADIATAQSILNDCQVVINLTTPITVQLTPEEVTLLKGDNVLTTDADNIDVEYSADIALYIAKKIAEGISQGNRSLSKGGSSEPEEETEEIKEEETKEEVKEEIKEEPTQEK